MAKTIQSKKFWIQTLFASTGAVVAGPAGSLIGGLVGELVVQVLPGAAQVVTSVTTGLIGETIPQLFGALGSDLTAGSSDQINHNLQTAFREACLRGLYDLGGSACFKAYWRSAGYNETQALAYFSTPEGRRLLHSEPDLADQIREHLLGMEREIQERWFASLDAEKGGSLDVTQYLHAELPAQKARAFFDTVLGSYLKQAGGLEHEFPGFVAHLRRHYMDRVLVHLGEQVKADDTTWRAFNRELLYKLRQGMAATEAGQAEIIDRLDTLISTTDTEALARWSNGMADLITATGAMEKRMDEGFAEVLERVTETHSDLVPRFNRVQIALDRVEHKVDRLLDKPTSLETTRPSTATTWVDVPDFDSNDFLRRPELVAKLRTRLSSPPHRTHVSVAAIQGIGGTGKSVLAREFGHDPVIRESYPDGIAWMTIGRTPQDLGKLCKVVGVNLFGDGPEYYEGKDAVGAKRLKEILCDKRFLLILDDVWKAEHVRMFLPAREGRYHVLFTTRNEGIARAVCDNILPLGMMSANQARALLTQISGRDDPELDEIAEVLHGLPLALNIAGTVIRSDEMAPDEWLEEYKENIYRLALDADLATYGTADNRHQSLVACLDLSAATLDRPRPDLYNALGVFPEGLHIPESLVKDMWNGWPSRGSDERVGEDVMNGAIRALNRLSLIERNAGDRTIWLHDLLHDYNVFKLGDRLPKAHQVLLSTLKPYEKRSWPTATQPGEENPYASYTSQWLGHHMLFAFPDGDARVKSLIREITKELERAERPDIHQEQVVMNLWTALWKRSDLTDDAEARIATKAFLIRDWLLRPLPHQDDKQYTARSLAVHAAIEAGGADVVAIAACHPDPRISGITMTHLHHLAQIEPRSIAPIVQAMVAQISRPKGEWSDEEIKTGIAAYAREKKYSDRKALPNRSVLKSVFFLAPLLAVGIHREGDEDTAVPGVHTAQPATDDRSGTTQEQTLINEVLPLLRQAVTDATQKSILGMLGSTGRALVTRVGVNMMTKLLEQSEAVSVNNVHTVRYFFKELPLKERNKTIAALDYLNRDHPDRARVPDVIFDLYQRRDRVSGMVADYVISAHGQHDLEMAKRALRHVAFDRKDPGYTDYGSATYMWYTLIRGLDKSTLDALEAVPTLRSFLEPWLTSELNKEQGYGRVELLGKTYPYTPLAWYTAIWQKWRPKVQPDLVVELKARAERNDDRKLKLHIIDTYADTRQVFSHPESVLELLTDYMEEVKGDDDPIEGSQPADIRAHLITTLATLRRLYRPQVTAFLNEHKVSAAFREQVLQECYADNTTANYAQVGYFVSDLVAYADTAFIDQIITLLKEALSKKTMGRMVAVIVNGLIDMAEIEDSTQE